MLCYCGTLITKETTFYFNNMTWASSFGGKTLQIFQSLPVIHDTERVGWGETWHLYISSQIDKIPDIFYLECITKTENWVYERECKTLYFVLNCPGSRDAFKR